MATLICPLEESVGAERHNIQVEFDFLIGFFDRLEIRFLLNFSFGGRAGTILLLEVKRLATEFRGTLAQIQNVGC